MNRRTFVTGAATVGVALSAGCLSSVGLGGPSFSDWYYAPGTVEDRDHMTVTYVDTVVLDDRSSDLGNFGEILESAVQSSLGGTGLDVDDTEWAAGSGGLGFAVTESIDEVRDDLEDNDFEEDSQESEYTIYTRNDRAFGVRDGFVLSSGTSRFVGSGGGDGEDIVEAMIEAETAETERYQDQNEDFRAALEAVDPAMFVSLQTFEERDETVVERGRFEDTVAAGNRIHLPDPEGDEAEFTVVFVYDEADDVDEDDVRDYVENHAASGDLGDVRLERDGRVLTVTGTGDVDDLF